MPSARNAIDSRKVYFEDDGGSGVPVVLYGGILDSVESVRASAAATALQDLSDEFRLIYADHRGLGRSDKPHGTNAYAMRLQVADATAILDALDVESAHVVGRSYGGRLAFGIAEHEPERALSIVAGGQQPYAIDPEGPLMRAVAGALEATRREGVGRFVEALEEYWDISIPHFERSVYLSQDGAAVAAAAEAMLTSGAISNRVSEWKVPCLVYLGAGDVDFLDQARRAASEIPNAEFLALDDLDHLAAHFEAELVIPAILRTLRAAR